ncbi:MAG: hypothetical protein GXP41_11305 [Chloroflexi bacterium]|nr:hypothetical protein [Chloroflexota bacterium]
MDIKGKLADTQGTLERLAHNIPGYTGYKNKEDRREADKQLRMVLAQRFQEQRDRLAEVQRQLTETGRLASIVPLERSMMKMQLLIDRVRTAAYGYSGFFDSIKVGEQQLEALQKFDSALTEQIQTVRKLIDQLAEAAAKEWETGTASKDLMTALEGINALFSRRQDVILGVEDDAGDLEDEPVQPEAAPEETTEPTTTTALPDEESPANPE